MSHQAAAGFNLPLENVDKFIEYAQKNLPKVERYFSVWTMEGSKNSIITQLATLDNHYGPGFEEILVYDQVYVNEQNMQRIGAKGNTVKVTGPDLDYIRFRYNDDLPQLPTVLGVVGKPNLNEFRGEITPQLFMEEWQAEEMDL